MKKYAFFDDGGSMKGLFSPYSFLDLSYFPHHKKCILFQTNKYDGGSANPPAGPSINCERQNAPAIMVPDVHET